MRARVLVVDDDPALAEMLGIVLRSEGFLPSFVADGERALTAFREARPDIVLLDLMLPGMSGLEVLRTMRAEAIDTPVVILSAKGGEVDRVVGLKVGADDYIPKPFSRPELLARVESVLRRQRRSDAADEERFAEVRSGALIIDTSRHLATFNGDPMRLTTKEFELLAHLAGHPGRIFTRDQLLTRIWPFDFGGDSRTVDVHISWLRSKLRALDGHNYFRTVRGVGYAFAPRQE